jgi:hypothetical protein
LLVGFDLIEEKILYKDPELKETLCIANLTKFMTEILCIENLTKLTNLTKFDAARQIFQTKYIITAEIQK